VQKRLNLSRCRLSCGLIVPRNYVLDGGPDPPVGRGNYEGEMEACSKVWRRSAVSYAKTCGPVLTIYILWCVHIHGSWTQISVYRAPMNTSREHGPWARVVCSEQPWTRDPRPTIHDLRAMIIVYRLHICRTDSRLVDTHNWISVRISSSFIPFDYFFLFLVPCGRLSWLSVRRTLNMSCHVIV